MGKAYVDNNIEMWLRGDTASVLMLYPKHNDIKYVEVNQSSVRASDGVRLYYDYDRDGFVIQQQRVFSGDTVDFDPMWTEVAFIQSWALEESEEEEE